ncbi:MAG: hypothetical protein HRT88_20985 [Lentisphaeraceae bacterium]|nr:hypothetical protein [Lentisphaeraceae bacterium]
MTAQHHFHTLPFCGMALYHISDTNTKMGELADKISTSSKDIHIGFDRSIWSEISSGQMPPQLYHFPTLNCKVRPKALQEVLVVLFKADSEFRTQVAQFNKDFDGALTQIFNMPFDTNQLACGAIAENDFEEEDFSDSYYLSFINWQQSCDKLVTPVTARSFPLSSKDQFALLSFSKDLNIQENWLEDTFGVYSGNQDLLLGNKAQLAAYFFFPSREILSELNERSRDKEKIHQASQISGSRC